MTELDLKAELEHTLTQLNYQIETLQNEWSEFGKDVYRARSKTGSPIMTPLLNAKAQVLSALVSLGSQELHAP